MLQTDASYIKQCDAWITAQELSIKSSLNRIECLEKGMAIDQELLAAEQKELEYKRETLENCRKDRQEVIDRN